jgi:large subunit ribosomal protein L37Ae
MGKTKKIGIAGRFGTRYGSTIRNRWRDVMQKTKGPQKCPKCETTIRNMREFLGVWHCKKCGARFTGGAWVPKTPRGLESYRIAHRQRQALTDDDGYEIEAPIDGE